MADITRNAPVGVILAAGSGLRLARDSKALARVAGVTLLERAVWALRRAGVERVVAVVGHRGDEVRRFVAERALPVELVENPDYVRGNGSSALVGGRAAGGRFVLMMVDHVVEPDAIARLLGREEPFVAAVDTAPAYCDREEATKVRLVGDHVVAVSRSLEGYEAVDAGLFACRPLVLAAAERALEEGAASWNDVKRRYLGEGGAITAVDLRGAWAELFVHAEFWRGVVALSGFAWSAKDEGARDAAGDDVPYACCAEAAPAGAGTTTLSPRRGRVGVLRQLGQPHGRQTRTASASAAELTPRYRTIMPNP